MSNVGRKLLFEEDEVPVWFPCRRRGSKVRDTSSPPRQVCPPTQGNKEAWQAPSGWLSGNHSGISPCSCRGCTVVIMKPREDNLLHPMCMYLEGHIIMLSTNIFLPRKEYSWKAFIRYTVDQITRATSQHPWTWKTMFHWNIECSWVTCFCLVS